MEMEVIYQNQEDDIFILKPFEKPFFIVQWAGDISKSLLRKILVLLYKNIEGQEKHQVIFNLKTAENFKISKLIALLPQFIPKFYKTEALKIAIVSNHKTHALSKSLWTTLGYLAHLKVQYFQNIKNAQDWFEGIEIKEEEIPTPAPVQVPQSSSPDKEEQKKDDNLALDSKKKNKLRIKFAVRSKKEVEEARNPFFRWLFKKVNE